MSEGIFYMLRGWLGNQRHLHWYGNETVLILGYGENLLE
jgi:hypothetical protein